MSLGLFGAHRVGKSTLAQAYSESTGCAFVQTTTSQVFARRGIDPSESLSFEERLSIQHDILEEAVLQWSACPEFFVTDRTPIDYMMYTLADIQGDTAPDYKEELAYYMEACFEALNKYFSTVILIQPGIPLVHEPGKAALNPLYIEHCNSLARGLAYDERCQVSTYYLKRSTLDLSDRVAAVENAVSVSAEKELESCPESVH